MDHSFTAASIVCIFFFLSPTVLSTTPTLMRGLLLFMITVGTGDYYYFYVNYTLQFTTNSSSGVIIKRVSCNSPTVDGGGGG